MTGEGTRDGFHRWCRVCVWWVVQSFNVLWGQIGAALKFPSYPQLVEEGEFPATFLTFVWRYVYAAPKAWSSVSCNVFRWLCESLWQVNSAISDVIRAVSSAQHPFNSVARGTRQPERLRPRSLVITSLWSTGYISNPSAFFDGVIFVGNAFIRHTHKRKTGKGKRKTENIEVQSFSILYSAFTICRTAGQRSPSLMI